MKLFTLTRLLSLALCMALCLASLPSPALDIGWSGDRPVQYGDNLWKIAGSSFSDPFLWPLIFNSNRDKISNPDLIRPGWRLSMPLDPSGEEMLAARQSAQLYKESQPMTAAPPVARSPEASIPVPQAGAMPASTLPYGLFDLTLLVYALYLLIFAAGVAVVVAMHMMEAPHHEESLQNPQGLALRPWASINEITGNSMPITEEEELQEAA